MSTQSPNLSLNLYSEEDVKERFLTFLEMLCGSGDNSNMMRIDAAIKALRDIFPTKADLVDGQIPASQLPSFVDDVVEYNTKAQFPILGEPGKIYVDISTNLTYRWSGSAYAEISPSLALGETASTAFRGDLGKAAYDHAQIGGNPHGTTAKDIGARPDTWTPTAAEVGARPSTWTPTASEVGADPYGAASAVQSNLNAHTGNTTMHITASERSSWNGKLDASKIVASTTDLTDGVSSLATGTLYLVYE